jgi:hypothetical protein
LSTHRPNPDSLSTPPARAILAPVAPARLQNPGIRSTPVRGENRDLLASSPRAIRALRYLALALFLLTPWPNRARPAVIRVPFRSVESMILIEGKVNSHHVVFLMDTGSNHTIVDAKTYREFDFPLRNVQRNPYGAGINGESISVRLDLQLADRMWVGQTVSVMNLDGLAKLLGIRQVDGLIGEDILRQFRSVRIDYNSHVVELEE